MSSQLAEMINVAYRIVMHPGTEEQLELSVLTVDDNTVEAADIDTGEEFTIGVDEFDLTRDYFFKLVETDQVENAVFAVLDPGTEYEMCYDVCAVVDEFVYVTSQSGEEYKLPITQFAPDNSRLYQLKRYISMDEYRNM